ncbi:hypothetical protein MA16_Dca025446 [Dendrobium catenatum]|uniref:DUF4283 domain-containing protein n=1 Tax=Dendrobium catenatum TaxID=906689 RepID=A0A2I0VQR0_9ASPA|nr:hypothetical protein MA16_Dca025446 [Dendrobium catenatum]
MANVWHKKSNRRIADLDIGNCLMKDGETIKLHEENVMKNTKKLQNSLVIKVFGDNILAYVINSKIKRQWLYLGKFNLTWLGKGWILCSFEDEEALDLVLSNGQWFVKGQIIGVEKRSTSFTPDSLKGLTTPIWIRMPSLPLQC